MVFCVYVNIHLDHLPLQLSLQSNAEYTYGILLVLKSAKNP